MPPPAPLLTGQPAVALARGPYQARLWSGGCCLPGHQACPSHPIFWLCTSRPSPCAHLSWCLSSLPHLTIGALQATWAPLPHSEAGGVAQPGFWGLSCWASDPGQEGWRWAALALSLSTITAPSWASISTLAKWDMNPSSAGLLGLDQG